VNNVRQDSSILSGLLELTERDIQQYFLGCVLTARDEGSS
jgi:hypothetical protein